LVALTLVSGVASAQDVYKVNYYANANTAGAPDGTFRISNPGLTYGTVWAAIYVYDQDQQLTECCACSVSHNGLVTFSVNTNLTSNPLTGRFSNTGTIKLVSSSSPDPTAVKPEANLRAWATHIQNKVGAAYPITETESSDSTLGATELSNLEAQCEFIGILGSGQGVCSCGTE
jgi:hypothetical protein